MRQRVVRELRSLNAIAVENPVLPGTPDVNYVEGWIELKWLRSWPSRGGIVTIPHFTPQQRVWHYRRRKAGGQSWFLLQCRREWILLDGAVAAMVVNKSTREELIEAANVTRGDYWNDGFDGKFLARYLNETKLPPFVFTPEDIARLRG
jgi:hypothetical protein